MPAKLSDIPFCKLMDKDMEKALSLENRFSFMNANLFPMLSKEEIELMMSFEDHLKKVSKSPVYQKVTEDIYPLFPLLGENHMLQRMNPFDGIEGSCKNQILLSLANVQLGPEVDMGVLASGILAGNSLFHNPKRTEIQQKAMEEIYRGTAVGGIGITEPERGSDAVNMQLEAKINPDQSITYNGTKVYTTNGAVADYLTSYGVTDVSDPRRTMMLTLFKRDDPGLKIERLHIPAASGVGIAKVEYNNITVSPDRMVAPPGEGYKRLFRGLTPERLSIMGSSIAAVWGSISTGILYSQVRHQFGKPIFSYQGISHVLADLYARCAAYTAFAFQIAEFYDKKIASKIHHGETPDAVDEGALAVMAAQGKYLTAKMAHEAAYEVVQTMGGRGAIDEPGSNNAINRMENLSRISEVVGGHRNIQLMLMEMGLRGTTAMAIQPSVDKSARNLRKENKHLTEIILAKAEKLLIESPDKIGDVKPELETAIAKLKAAEESGNKIELEAYSKALPKLFAAASKAVYKASKNN